MSQQVLVLNASYEPINVCSLQRAIVLVLKEKAEVLERAAARLRSAAGAVLDHPLVIRLRYYVSVPRHSARKISRRAVFARDGYRCQYCDAGAQLTLDHVIPRSRGGHSGWDNVVTCCSPCNLRKGDRTPDEIGWTLRASPRPPRPDVFISVAAPRHPRSWEQYLPS